MKKLIAIAIAAFLALGIAFNGTCYADHGNRHGGHNRHYHHRDRAWAATAGFMGGFIAGSAYSRPYYYRCYSYPVYYTYVPAPYYYPPRCHPYYRTEYIPY